jgi:glycosyltransferase involved in cell wall biosynthesis
VTDRIPILYLAPWVDYGGSDTNTLDWFRWLDRSRFAPSLITTQPSSNRRLSEVVPYAEEVWALPEAMEGREFPQFIAEFIVSRKIEIVHVMNSRIGFDLLPDFRALKHPPKVVVQLHVEEPTRDGYVRYVTTRYGNLVDAYSVSSAHVADAVVGYGLSRDRVVVIPTGIDTDHFRRDRAGLATPNLDADRVHLMFIARLVEQKDPLLMVEVARILRERNLQFCIHVIGGGHLEPDVRARVAEYGLQGGVVLEAPTHELRPWYANADILLMTSVFEGIPVIVYEALAMEMPIVAPSLPGIVELMGDVGGSLVARRDCAADYADALEPLIRDREARQAMGRSGRELVMHEYSVQRMTAQHGELYEQLLSDGRQSAEEPVFPPPHARRFATRPARGTPLVSVVTPCFNHGRLLRQCVESIQRQTYSNVEMIVVDDGSTEGDTRSYLDELERERGVRVVRAESNGGPSAARNLGIRHSAGRYVLPVDADNLLLPDAIERLVMQLQGAGEHVGYIYQNCQYFGNREDYFEPPKYNSWLITLQNYIDTCALIDREVFDAGMTYAEDIVFGHEDWDFFLQLAANGIQGEPARSKTLLYRKEGFTRSDLVEWTGSPFHAELGGRHPTLFPNYSGQERASGSSVELKARWAPALSLVAILPLEVDGPAWEVVRTRLRTQRFRDLELLVQLDRDPVEEGWPPIRRLPSGLAGGGAECLAHALEVCRGRHVVVTNRSLPDLLGDPGTTERIVRALERPSRTNALCLADAGADRHPFSLLQGDESDPAPHSVAFSRRGERAPPLPRWLDTGDPLGGLARWMQIERHRVEWRHLAASWMTQPTPSGSFHRVVVAPDGPRAERAEHKLRVGAEPVYPGARAPVARWAAIPTWLPATTAPLVRHRALGTGGWTVTTSLTSPEGYHAEFYLGVVHMRALEGTRRIMCDPHNGYVAIPRGAEPSADQMDKSLGYVDEVAFAMLEPLLLCRHVGSGALLLLCGEDDPLRDVVEWPHLAVLGYIDRFPVNPHHVETHESTAWLRGLLRSADLVGRCHRVAFGKAPTEHGLWELGALLDRNPGGGIATWIDADGHLHTQDYVPTRHPYELRKTLRWVAAPASWRGFGRRWARTRAVARRAIQAVRHARVRPDIAAPVPYDGEAVAWLLPDPGPDRHPLFSAIHPVTADQLVTRDPSEARELGYGPEQILGYALAAAPETGSLRRPHMSVPWGSRFGEALTRSQDPHPDNG